MKKSLYLILIAILFVAGSIEVNASSGALRKASIKTCNGITYGQHSSDNHWHVAEESDGKYYATGNPIYSDPCSSSGGSSNNNNSNNDSGSNNSSNNNTSGESSNNNTSNNNNAGGNSSTNNNTTTNSNNGGSTSNGTTNNNTTTKPNNSGTTSNQDTTPKEEPKNSDNTLKVILIDGKEIKISDDIKYSTTKEKVNIEATPNDEKATFEIKNNDELSIGENKVEIEVKAEDGKIKTYSIMITREVILSNDTSIKVTVDDEEVMFENNKATIYVSSSATSVTIDYKLGNDKAKVEMDKLENLKTGDNPLKIKGTEKEYEIIIHKYTKTEDIISTILAFALLGGFGYGIYFIIKKGKKLINKFKLINKK